MFYKVVAINRIGDRISALARRKAAMLYDIDRVNRAPMWARKSGYGLFVFTSRNAAYDFLRIAASENSEVELWKVNVSDTLPAKNIVSLHKLSERKIDNPEWPFPESTVMAEYVEFNVLVERVYGVI